MEHGKHKMGNGMMMTDVEMKKQMGEKVKEKVMKRKKKKMGK